MVKIPVMSVRSRTDATVDCIDKGCGCVALIVDGVVVSGPPFHPHCGCSLSQQDIENAESHKSNSSYAFILGVIA